MKHPISVSTKPAAGHEGDHEEQVKMYGDGIHGMEDDDLFANRDLPLAAFVEVTTGHCKINGPWTHREKANIPRALRALGAVPDPEVDTASASIYETGSCRTDQTELRLISIGRELSDELSKTFPEVMQIEWSRIKAFIFDRFQRYEAVKRKHPQWDFDGHLLWHIFQGSRGDSDGFVDSIDLVTTRPTKEQISEYVERARLRSR